MPEVDEAIATWLKRGLGVPILPTSLYGQSGSKLGWYVDYVSSLLADPWSAKNIIDAVAVSHNIPTNIVNVAEYVYNLIVFRSMKMRNVDMRRTINPKKLSRYHTLKAEKHAKVRMELEMGGPGDDYPYPPDRVKPPARRTSM